MGGGGRVMPWVWAHETIWSLVCCPQEGELAYGIASPLEELGFGGHRRHIPLEWELRALGDRERWL